jgi:ABC-2 type transport system permease protein
MTAAPPASVFHQVGKYAAIARLSLRNAFVYRGNVLGGLLFFSLFIFVFFSLWKAIYQGGEVAGYSLVQVVWYLCLTELLVFGCRTSVFSQMSEDIKTGAVAYLLLRPSHYIPYQLAYAAGGIGFNLAAFGCLAVVLGLLMVGPLPDYHPEYLPFAIVSGLLGILLNFFLLMALGLTAFRLEENGAFHLIYQKLVFMLGMFIPLEFLPGWLQNIARWLPFPYVAWAPARLIVAFSWNLFWQVLPMQLGWLILAILLSCLIYRSGVRNIQANGG